MSSMDEFSPLLEHPHKGGLVNDDDMMALADDLLAASCPAELPALPLGPSLFPDLASDLSALPTDPFAGLFPPSSLASAASLPLELPSASFQPALRSGENLPMPQATLPGPITLVPYGNHTLAIPTSSLHLLNGLFPAGPPQSGSPLRGPSVGRATVFDSVGNGAVVDADAAATLASASGHAAHPACNGAAAAPPDVLPQPAAAASHQPKRRKHKHKSRSSSVATPVPAPALASAPTPAGSSVSAPPPLLPHAAPAAAVDAGSVERLKALASELYASLSREQIAELDALHQQAKDGGEAAGSAAASKQFWERWYAFAPATKVSEFKRLWSQLHGSPKSTSALGCPPAAPLSSRQESNHSHCSSDDCDTLTAAPHRVPGSKRKHWGGNTAVADAEANAAVDKPVAGQGATSVQDVMQALQEFSCMTSGRLASLESSVRALEATATAERAARQAAEARVAELAATVGRLRAALCEGTGLATCTV